MSDLPPETRHRLHAYIREIVPPELVDELRARVEQQLTERRTNQLVQVLAIAHETVIARIRVTPDAAASALIDGGGLTPRVAARIAGIPVERLQAGAEDEPEPDPGPELGRDGPEPGPEPAGGGPEPDPEPGADPQAVIEGWGDFWTPPAVARTEDTADEALEEDDPSEADLPRPSASRLPRTFETWAGGGHGRSRRSGIPVAAAAGVIGLLVVVVVVLALSDDGGEPLADRITPPVTGDATSAPATEPTDATATDAPVTPTDGPPRSELAVDSVVVGAPGGEPNRMGAPVPVGFSVSGLDDGPSTLRWELERDGQPVFPAAPLVVPADGDVRLTVPPALLSDPGSYVVRVTDGGTVLLEEIFEITG